jgi:hypothetical protein
MDPRKAASLRPFSNNTQQQGMTTTTTTTTTTTKKSKTIWANLGASQFHLPFGPVGQQIPGQIGLYYHRPDALDRLKKRIQEYPSCYATFEIGHDDSSTKREYVKLNDHYGNCFVCRIKELQQPQQLQQEGEQEDAAAVAVAASGQAGGQRRQPFRHQPIVALTDTEQWDTIATTYGIDDGDEGTECQGIDYVEFLCPPGSASKIALFYESLLDATTSVVTLPTTKEGSSSSSFEQSIAIIAIGDIYESGRSEQSLLFRETSDEIPPYDGHHIALYVGQSTADFEQAFRNTQIAGILWKNPRFSDQVDNLEEARKEQQFRFKDILDIETGEVIMELEHEMRSIDHESFPGYKQ